MLAAALVMAAAVQAAAPKPSPFKLIFANTAEAVIVNRKDVNQTPEGYMKIWFNALRAPGHETSGMSVIKLEEIVDCVHHRSQTVYAVGYDKQMSQLESRPISSPEWTDTIPDTSSQAVESFACAAPGHEPGTDVSTNLGDIVRGIYAGPWPVPSQ